MKMQRIIEWDQCLFLICQKRVQNHPKLKKTMVWVSKLSHMVFAAIYFSVAGILLLKHDPMLIRFLVVPAMTLLLTAILRRILHRPRPYETFKIETGIAYETGSSFPSQHTSSAMIIALSILWVYPPVGVVMISLALLTAVSRVISGVHFPLDVFAGTLLACLTSGLLLLGGK